MSSPSISIVIPTWNYGRFIGDAITSVLAQNWPNLEMIVSDDGSTDDTAEVVSRFDHGVTYVRREVQGGSAAARNTGLDRASGELIGFLDSDDAMALGSLRILVKALEEHPTVDAAYGLVAQVQQVHFERARMSPQDFLQGALPCWMAGGMLFRREALFSVARQDERFSTGEFLSWLSEARDSGMKFVHRPVLSLLRRIHGANKMLHTTEIATEYAKLLKRHLDRRRAAAAEGAAQPP
jgi:glycosyltransferase involved in cell wall biosynthesis